MYQALNIFALGVLLLTIGCKVSPICLYYTKLAILYLGLINFGNMLSIHGLFHKSYETSRFGKTCLDPVGKLLNIQYFVKGQDMINENRAYIVIANHQHALDLVSMMQVRTDVNIDRRISQ